MKSKHPLFSSFGHGHPGRRWRSAGKCLLSAKSLAAIAALIGLGALLLRAQFAGREEAGAVQAPALSEADIKESLLDPAAFEARMRPLKSQERLEQEARAAYAFSNPREFAAQFEAQKDPQRKQKEQRARAAMLDPVAHSGDVELLKAERKAKKERGELEGEDSMLRPKFRSSNVSDRAPEKEPQDLDKARKRF